MLTSIWLLNKKNNLFVFIFGENFLLKKEFGIDQWMFRMNSIYNLWMNFDKKKCSENRNEEKY